MYEFNPTSPLCSRYNDVYAYLIVTGYGQGQGQFYELQNFIQPIYYILYPNPNRYSHDLQIMLSLSYDRTISTRSEARAGFWGHKRINIFTWQVKFERDSFDQRIKKECGNELKILFLRLDHTISFIHHKESIFEEKRIVLIKHMHANTIHVIKRQSKISFCSSK